MQSLFKQKVKYNSLGSVRENQPDFRERSEEIIRKNTEKPKYSNIFMLAGNTEYIPQIKQSQGTQQLL